MYQSMNKTRKILMVVTNFGCIDSEHSTGIWYKGLAVTYQELIGQGFEVTIASPEGGVAPLDPRSLPKEEERDSIWRKLQNLLQNTQVLENCQANDFEALVFPGGHGNMFDCYQNKVIQQIASKFVVAGKLIAALCHGPVGLIGVNLPNGNSLLGGKTLTSFTVEEERTIGWDVVVPFLLENKLRELGANFVGEPKFSDHIEQDGKLITGQNPQSSQSFVNAVINDLRH